MTTISDAKWRINGLRPSERDNRAGYQAGATDAVRGRPAADNSDASEHYRAGYARAWAYAFRPEAREYTEWLISLRVGRKVMSS